MFEYSDARPFERPLPQPTPFVLHGSSPYWKAPITYTESGKPAGV